MSGTNVIVVGAGLAGATAASTLKQSGCRVRLLEARDRFGGRAFARNFAASHEHLEFGGAWITPWHHHVRSLADQYGLELRPRHEVTQRLWLRSGNINADGPADRENHTAHERAIARVAADAILLKKGHRENERGEALTGISFSDYLNRLDCPQSTRDIFSAWWTVSGNGSHRLVAASEFLASCAYDNGLAEGMIRYWVHTVTPSMNDLVGRMIRSSGVEVTLSAPVHRVTQHSDHVEVLTGSETHVAKACVLALGLNQMKGIEFAPQLGVHKQEAIARGHGGSSFKLWIRAEGVPVGTLATGNGRGIEFAFAERTASDDRSLVVAFGLMNENTHPEDAAWIRSEFAKLFPQARMLSYDWHDWLNDPFSRGTWVAAFAGHEGDLDPKAWAPEGRIAFASSDYARDQAGWFEGAIISGRDAAAEILKVLTS